MDADERRQQPLPVKLGNDERIGGHGEILELSGLTEGIGQVRQYRRSGGRRRSAIGSCERGDVRFLGSQDAFDAAAGALGKTRGGERGVIKCVKDGRVVVDLYLLLSQEQVEELTIDLKRECGGRAGEGTGGEHGSASREQTATARAASGDHRLVLPYTGGQFSIQPPSTRYVPPVQ